MKKLLSILFLLPMFLMAQPGGYTAGTRVEWTFNSRSHTFFMASGWNPATDVTIVFGRGDGQTSTSGSSAHTLSKWILDAGPNWDGTITLPDNSKKKVMILEINNTSSANYDLYEADVAYFFENTDADSSAHDKNLIGALSGGCKRLMALLCNYYGESLSYDYPYRHVFGHAAFMSTPDLSEFDFSVLNPNIQFWWMVGEDDAGLTAPVHTENAHSFTESVGNISKISQLPGGGHGDDTWDNYWDTTTATKTVDEKVMVWAFGSENVSPVSNAGSDQSLSVGTTSTTVDGSASNDPDGTITTYAWTRISGPNTPTIVDDDQAETDITGMIAGTYVFRLTVTDNDGATDTDDIQIAIASPAPNKITGITATDIIMMSPGTGTYFPFRFFDEPNADPGNGTNTPLPTHLTPGSAPLTATTTGRPATPNYYSWWLNDEFTFAVDFRGTVTLTDLYAYIPDTYFDDSLIIYTGGFGFGQTWTRVASVYVAAGYTGWKHIPLTGSSRYLRIGFKGNYVGGIKTALDVDEFIVYGDYTTERDPAPPAVYTGIYRPYPTFREQQGKNHNIGYVKTKFKKYNSWERHGLYTEWIDYDTTEYPNNVYDYDFVLDPTISGTYATEPWRNEHRIADSTNKMGNNYFTMWHHANHRAVMQGESVEGFNTNNHAENPYLFQNYTRWGDLFFQRAARYGLTPVADTNILRVIGTERFTGLGTSLIHQDANEIWREWGGGDTVDAGAFKIFTITQYAVSSNMTYDGYERRYRADNGYTNIGLKVADSNSKLMMNAIVGLADTLSESSVIKTVKAMRTDGLNIYDWSDYHYYLKEYFYNPTTGFLDSTRGKHPVKDSLSRRLNKVADFHYRMDSTTLLACTETGYNGAYPSEYSYWQDGYTHRQTQAIGRLYTKLEFAKTHFDMLTMYTSFGNAVEADNSLFQTSQEGRTYSAYLGVSQDSMMEPHYIEYQFDSLFGNFRYDTEIAYGWNGVYNTRFVSKTNSDSLMYAVAYSNTSGITSTQNINVGLNKRVVKIDLSWMTYAPSVTVLTPDGSGNVSVSLADKPVFLIATPSSGGTRVYRNRIIRQ